MTTKFRAQRMDEEEAWRINYEFIAEHYPKLKRRAYDFYLQRVNNLIHAIAPPDRIEFQKEYRYLHEILQRNLLYILVGSQLKLKYRIRFLLDFFKL